MLNSAKESLDKVQESMTGSKQICLQCYHIDNDSTSLSVLLIITSPEATAFVVMDRCQILSPS